MRIAAYRSQSIYITAAQSVRFLLRKKFRNKLVDGNRISCSPMFRFCRVSSRPHDCAVVWLTDLHCSHQDFVLDLKKPAF